MEEEGCQELLFSKVEKVLGGAERHLPVLVHQRRGEVLAIK